MTDHPVLIPTSEGPIGGIVSESPAERQAALILLAGYGRPARSGVNAFWTRVARRLAEMGVVVLRVDYGREGETLPIGVDGPAVQNWKRELDLRLLGQVVPWFADRTEGVPLLFAGLCSGARAGIELGGRCPGMFAATFLMVPHMRVPFGAKRRAGRWRRLRQTAAALRLPPAGPHDDPDDPEAIDPLIVDRLRALLAHGCSWLLVGEEDATAGIPRLRQALGRTENPLEVEIVPRMALHLADRPPVQQEIESRLLARVGQELLGRDPHSS